MIRIENAFDDDGREYFFAREILLKEGKEVFSQAVTESSYLREVIEDAVKWLEELEKRPENNPSFFPQVKNKEVFPSLQIFPFPEVENAYLALSFCRINSTGGIVPNLTFLYQINSSTAIEWELSYRPFTKLTACDESYPTSQKHYFFPYITGYGDWGQLIVEKSGIAEQVKAGNFKEVFQILKTFGESCA